LFLQNQSLSKDVIPFSCKLSSEKRIMVISGPNAGGKSITLKTIGLIQLMLQSGILVPVDERSEIGVFRQLFTDIGDNQSIEYELSTYSSRLQKMKYFLEFADSKTLVLIDEFGTGTDPELGGAMAEVILEELNNKKSIGVVTTHYTNIKLAAEQLNGTFNACMLFDDKTLKPLYQLLIGQPGSSYTFVIAEKSGLSRNVIERAKDKIDTDKVKLDQLLRQLQSERQKAKNEANKYIEQFSLSIEKQLKYEELYDKWKAKLENSQANNESNQKYIQAGKKFIQLMNEWEKSKDKKEFSKYLTKLFTAEKKKKIEKKMTASKNKKKEIFIEQIKQDLKVGSRVKLLNGKQIGVVEEILNNKARVTFGAIKSLCGLENLQLVNE
jgi:DNA mismatch repair protein MutS2